MHAMATSPASLSIPTSPTSPALGENMVAALLRAHWPVLATVPAALSWLCMRTDLGIAPRTLHAYARGLSEYRAFCAAPRPVGVSEPGETMPTVGIAC